VTAPDEQVTALERWRDFGGTWQVLARSPGRATVSLCRCDQGEEVERLIVTSAAALDWLEHNEP
jgi:hypothetical protein